jgi:hypothetical protein
MYKPKRRLQCSHPLLLGTLPYHRGLGLGHSILDGLNYSQT